MSKAGGGKKGAAAASKGAGKVAAAATDESTSERATPAAGKSAAASAADMDVKDDVSSNGDKKDIKGTAAAAASTDDANPAKPQSAGASVRDAAQKLLGLTMRQEWTPIEQVIKSLEKAVAAAGDEMNLSPLAGVLDPVSIYIFGIVQNE